MVDAIRLARRQFGAWMVTPAVASWAGLFGYQWAFSLSYHGPMPTVFNYYSGMLGDGILIPAANARVLEEKEVTEEVLAAYRRNVTSYIEGRTKKWRAAATKSDD